MKKDNRRVRDDLRPEYDLASLGTGARGKYPGRLKRTTLVALEPEVADAFPTSQAVNEALRAVLRATRIVRRTTRAGKRASGTRGTRRK